MDRGALLQMFVDLYRRDHEQLTTADVDGFFRKAEQWNLTSVLSDGGVLSFPHARVADCGHQVAACANAVISSGADTCVFISVLHSSSQAMEDARNGVANGDDPSLVSTVVKTGATTTRRPAFGS